MCYTPKKSRLPITQSIKNLEYNNLISKKIIEILNIFIQQKFDQM